MPDAHRVKGWELFAARFLREAPFSSRVRLDNGSSIEGKLTDRLVDRDCSGDERHNGW